MTDPDTQSDHWRPGRPGDPPISAARITAYEAVVRLCQAETLFWDETVRSLTHPVHPALTAHAGRQARVLGAAILDGRLQSWARPIGGGPIERLGPAQWEIDDFTPRFATSAINLPEWMNPAAPPTHYVFIDEIQFERFVAEHLADRGWEDERDPSTRPGADAQPETAVAPPTAGGPELRARAIPAIRRFIRLPEVKRRTSLSRSGIYERMGAGTFPKSMPLGPKTSAWYDDEVDDWVAGQARTQEREMLKD